MITGLLVLVGTGLIILGLAHAGLPRWLGWHPGSLTDAGPLSALVVRMHVYFFGVLLVLLGLLTVVAAAGPPTVLARVLYGGAAVLFALRTVVEVRWVGRVITGGAVRWLHRVALVAWPAAGLIYTLGVITL